MLCVQQWIKDYSITTNIGSGYKYLLCKIVLIMKLNLRDNIYITLVIHIDGNIECIFDSDIIYDEIKTGVEL